MLITDDVNEMQTVIKKVATQKIIVAAIDDLIGLKRKAGRPQDVEDIQALEKLR